jgi:catechol 2,3-dioxygenase-like lactoylglutathione lyase family enzyme
MNQLTEQQRTYYAAVANNKIVEWYGVNKKTWHTYEGNGDDPTLGDPAYEWRIIDPETITVSYTIPKPMIEPPELGGTYWYIDNDGLAELAYYDGAGYEKLRCEAFNMFATREDAEAAHTARTAAYREASGV